MFREENSLRQSTKNHYSKQRLNFFFPSSSLFSQGCKVNLLEKGCRGCRFGFCVHVFVFHPFPAASSESCSTEGCVENQSAFL